MNTDMKLSTLWRHHREGAKSVVRNGWMSFASISSISISLFILGVFLILALNVNHLADQIESQVEIRVHLEVGATENQVRSLQNEIGSLSGVRKVTFVSKEEGLEVLKEALGEDGAELLKGYEGDSNPLPDSFTVLVDQPDDVAPTAEQIESLDEGRQTPLIFKVIYGEGTVETMFKILETIRMVGLILVIGLAFTAMFLISNTIKITITARRREISIMKLVGATNSFIRWPFFIEGLLLGLIGSVIPIAILLFGYSSFVDASQFNLGLLMIQLLPFHEIAFVVSGLLLGIGLVIGVWGSTLSVRKFLKI